MKREIKFRAWDNVDYMSGPFDLKDIQNGLIQFTLDCPVIQSTGLKDKNGKEIYEGDVISRIKYSSNYRVDWNERDAKFQMKRIGDDYPLDFFELRAFNEEIEVIGNIYENPELLK